MYFQRAPNSNRPAAKIRLEAGRAERGSGMQPLLHVSTDGGETPAHGQDRGDADYHNASSRIPRKPQRPMNTTDPPNPPSPTGQSWRGLGCNTGAALKALGGGK